MHTGRLGCSWGSIQVYGASQHAYMVPYRLSFHTSLWCLNIYIKIWNLTIHSQKGQHAIIHKRGQQPVILTYVSFSPDLGFVLDFLVVLVAPVVFPAVFLFLTAATFLLSAAFPALDAVVGATGRATGWFSPIKTESGSGPCCMSEGPLEAYMIVIYCEHTSWSICDSMVSLGYKVRRRWWAYLMEHLW